MVCFGGAAIDHSYRASVLLRRDTSNPARGRTGFGGVARNVAETLARLGIRSALVSAVGDDPAGRALVAQLASIGVDVSGTAVITGSATASYVAALDVDGSLALGLSDMAVLAALTPAAIAAARPLLGRSPWVFADCNLDAAALAAVADETARAGGLLAVDAVSVAKATHVRDALDRLALLFLNADEARALVPDAPASATPHELAASLVARGVGTVVLTRGGAGTIVRQPRRMIAVPAVTAERIDATGAGDALIAATLARLVDGDDVVQAVRIGTLAAALAVEVIGAVRPDLDPGLLERSRYRVPPLSSDQEP